MFSIHGRKEKGREKWGGKGKGEVFTCPTTFVLPPPPSRTIPQTIQGRRRIPIEMCKASLTVGLGWKVLREKSFCSQWGRGVCFMLCLERMRRGTKEWKSGRKTR